jgi:thiamine kinase
LNKVEQALSGWKDWKILLIEEPKVVRELFGGLTNRSFLIESGKHRMVIRINNKDFKNLGINRSQEIQILSLLHGLDFLPEILFLNEDFLVSGYVEGYQWLENDFHISSNKEKISKIIKKIHNVKLPQHVVKRNYLNYCYNYIQQLSPATIALEGSLCSRLLEVAASIDKKVWTPVINHHDIIQGNVIENDSGLFLIDWEYAAFGHPGIDLARLYGMSYKSPVVEKLVFLQHGIDKLWALVKK